MDSSEIAVLSAAMVAAGALGGLTAGILGVGGGIIIVPILYQVYSFIGIDPDIRMHLAVGTSLATIIPTSISSARAHFKRDGVDRRILVTWSPWVVVGVGIGSVVAQWVPSQLLGSVFAVAATIVALNLALRSETAPLFSRPPQGYARAISGAAVGTVSTMMGIGGGTFMVPLLSACSLPIKRAVGTAAAIGLVISVPGTVGFILGGVDVPNRPAFSFGYVNLVGFALLAPMSILMAPVGARIAHAISPTTLRVLFCAFLLASAARIGWDVVARF
ncbi:sulfite exporter TauE/SafE family protein [Erythrobacter sp. NFXS35]|uniref:sulfite exporter TauE/SafE family protein n=1 Tax=Erythrobacter sp. NFXS35 TaxID=2818436 RepID=UPI0032DFAF42